MTENLKTLEQEEKELVIRETEMHTFRDCPICLETFNDTDSVIVILCSHKFHYKCLREWRDQTCPICRYQQYPFELLFCEKCDIHENLWCCIICGLIGCGGLIPLSGHIRDHALEANHIYSKPILRDVNSTRQKGIFDHTTTDFVQSLTYNSQLGSIVANEANQCDKKDKKHKDVSEEINQLISSTLDSQRQFYKEEMRKLEAEFDKIKKDSTEMCNYIQAEIDSVQAELINMTSLVDDGRDSFHKLESIYHTLSEKLAALKRENQKLKKSKKGKEEVIELAREAKRQELAKIKKQIAEKLVEIKDMKVHIENKIKIDALPVQQGSSIMILGTGNKKSKK